MANLTITNYDNAGVLLGDNLFEDGLLNFSGADDYAEGALLGRIDVAAGTVVAGTNTGNGTITGFAIAASKELPKVGNYIFVLTAALVGDLKDPDGNIIAKGVALNDGTTTTITANGLTFIVTDGATAFAAGDSFTLPVAVGSGKYVAYASDGVAGAQFPVSVLAENVSASGAGDVPFRVMVRGDVRKEKCFADATPTVALTDTEIRELEKNNIFAISVSEKNIADNQ